MTATLIGRMKMAKGEKDPDCRERYDDLHPTHFLGQLGRDHGEAHHDER